MYLDQLRHEQHMSILAGIRRWTAVLHALETALARLRAVFAIDHSDTLTTFSVHRVPGADSLR